MKHFFFNFKECHLKQSLNIIENVIEELDTIESNFNILFWKTKDYSIEDLLNQYLNLVSTSDKILQDKTSNNSTK